MVPVVFKTHELEKAKTVVGIISPRYYMIGYVCGILVLVALLLSGPAALQWFTWGIMIFGAACVAWQ